jgi:hypothetical protein
VAPPPSSSSLFYIMTKKNEKKIGSKLGGSGSGGTWCVAYFGADLRGARWAAVVPFGTAFFLEGGAEVAEVVCWGAVGGGSVDGAESLASLVAGLPLCVSEDAAVPVGGVGGGAALGALRRALRLAWEDFVLVDGRFVPVLADDDGPAPELEAAGVEASPSSSMSSSSSSSSGSSSSASSAAAAAAASSPVSPLKVMNFLPIFASFTRSVTRNLPVRAGEALDGGLSPSSWRVDIWGVSMSTSLSVGWEGWPSLAGGS